MKIQQELFLKKIEQHRGILSKVTMMYCSNELDREDLEQEIIYHLWKSFSRFKGESLFSTWMYRVAVNTSITFSKKEKKRINILAISQDFKPSKAVLITEGNNRVTYFYQAVQQLNKIEKALIFLFLEGLSHKEIADNLGITVGNARVKLNRTKAKLQKIIKDIGYEF